MTDLAAHAGRVQVVSGRERWEIVRRGAGLPLLFLLLGDPTAAGAQDEPRITPYGAFNLVGQTSAVDSLRSELAGSLDGFADVRLGDVRFHLYVEGSTTPRGGGISTVVPAANTDAGTALDADGDGRVQISEARFAVPLGPEVVWHVGLMDLTGFLDVSRIANDENLFFLGMPFVNNPTIGFPDYTLGTVVEAAPRGLDGLQLTAAVSSSRGLADLPQASYGELFDLTAPGRGAFVATRVRWEKDRWSGSLGGWVDTEGFATPSSGSSSTRGVFSVLGVEQGGHSVSGRLGLASEGARSATSFLGLTYLLTDGNVAWGTGIGRVGSSPTLDRSWTHVETFVRRRLVSRVYMTASTQWLSATPAGAGGPPEGAAGAWVWGFRLSAQL